MMFSLEGKKALVTGGSRGIGRGIALALALQGADVMINYHSNAEEANKVVEEIKKMGRQSVTVAADVSNSQSIGKMFEYIKSQWGKLDILVNNAGIISYADFESLTEEDWDKIMAVNLKGQFLCKNH
jgi:NAD(P)-dependent dehydrogenase (short-subunit alcohol dehydrogenase family)